jgi:hypothetical protein
MTNMKSFTRAINLVFHDPKFEAAIEWHREYGIPAQLQRQWGRDDMAQYVNTGQHVRPDHSVTLYAEEIPDFDWWEPRHDQPWRRQNTRANEIGVPLR